MTIDKAVLEAARDRAGMHGGDAPADPRQRELFGLMEVLDFKCLEYGDFSGTTEQEIKAYLVEHRAEVRLLPSPPSYLALLSGRFDFVLIDAAEGEATA